ncbi:MAG: DUF3971 domain-containing protein [Rubellimicrobium sp.]|nr:DUF3971 domain-containing protein [Rubellimicrobium sp.]
MAGPEATSRPRSPRGLRLAAGGLWRLMLLPLVFVLVALPGLWRQDITAPAWLKARIEAQAGAVLGGGTLDFGRLTLRLGRDLRPVARFEDSEFRDDSGRRLARVPLMEVTLSPRGLILRREVLPQRVTLSGAQVSLTRAADGSIGLALGEDGAAPGALDAPDLVALAGMIDDIFDLPALAALRQVTLSGLGMEYADLHAGRSWHVDGGSFDVDLGRDSVRAQGNFGILSGRAFATTLALSYASPRASRAAVFDLSLSDAAATDIASQAPALGWLAVIDARLSGTIHAGLDAGGALAAFSATLDIGAGSLAPEGTARPLHFEGAEARVDYDPQRGTLGFPRVAVISDWGRIEAQGHAQLMAGEGPQTVVGQFALSGAALNPAGVLSAPAILPPSTVDMRLRLDPFTLDIGQLAVAPAADGGSGQVLASAHVAAGADGWQVAVDATLDHVTTGRFAALWPEGLFAPSRDWFRSHVEAGVLNGLAMGLRAGPGQEMRLAITSRFRDARILAVTGLPPLTEAAGRVELQPDLFSVSVTQATVTPSEGGSIDMGGLTFTIPDTHASPQPAVVGLRGRGPVTAMASLLDAPGLHLLGPAGLAVDMAGGEAEVTGVLRYPLHWPLTPADFNLELAAALSDVDSTRLVPGRHLQAARLDLRATMTQLEVSGAGTLDGLPVSGTFVTGFGRDAAPAQVDGTVTLSPASLAAFGIPLPEGTLSGEGPASFALEMPQGGPVRYRLRSDLRGLAVSIPALGWRKARDAAGALDVAGTLGAPPGVEDLALTAPGLAVHGRVTLAPGGGFARADLSRVSVGSWLDAPVTLVGRGAGRAPEVRIEGGTLDMRRATLGGGGDGAVGTGGGPLALALDRLQVTEGIALTGFRGSFTDQGGLSGQFTAAVNGVAAVAGTVVPMAGRSAVRITAGDSGAVLGAAGFLDDAQGGGFDLTLLPVGEEGNYDGSLDIADLRVRNAPALASLLNAISVVGLLQQMTGQGLVFDDVRADFRLTPDRIVLRSASAVGAGLGISLDGVYTLANNWMDFQGVISPFYLVNSIGSILTRRGEGLIGFNFTLRGPVGAAQVGVNPLSVLTPGMFREIFRRPPPQVE